MLINPSAATSPWPNFDVTRNRLLLSSSPTRDLILFLYLGIPMERSRLGPFFSDADLSGLESAGFIQITDGQVLPRRIVIPFQGLYFFADIPTFFPTARVDDPVYMGFDSFLLAGLLPRGTGRALDLCCGTGIHAILLAAQGYEVIGADIDPRAVEISQVNAAFNHLTKSTEFRQGDLLDPVDGLFDVIVTKPPCQAIPDEIEGYPMVGNGGPDGLRIARRILNDVNRYLAPGGRLATVLQVLGDDRTVPFAAELEALATLHSWRVRLFLARRIPVERQVDLLAPYASGITAQDRVAWREGLAEKGYSFLYNAILDIQRCSTAGVDVAHVGFPQYDEAYRVDEGSLQFEETVMLEPAEWPLTPIQRAAIDLCDGTRTVEKVTDILCRRAAETSVSGGSVRSQVDEIVLWLLEQGYLRRRSQ